MVTNDQMISIWVFVSGLSNVEWSLYVGEDLWLLSFAVKRPDVLKDGL